MFESVRNRHFTTVFDLLKSKAQELQTVSDVSTCNLTFFTCFLGRTELVIFMLVADFSLMNLF